MMALTSSYDSILLVFLLTSNKKVDSMSSSLASLLEILEVRVELKKKTKPMITSSTIAKAPMSAMQAEKSLSLSSMQQYMILSPAQYTQIEIDKILWQSRATQFFIPRGYLQTRSSIYLEVQYSTMQAASSITMNDWKQDRKKAVVKREEMKREQKAARGKGIGQNPWLASSWVIQQFSFFLLSRQNLMNLMNRCTLKYQARGLKMFPREMVRREKARVSRGVTAGSGLSSFENWKQRKMVRGLMDRLTKMKKVSLLTRLSTLLELSSCTQISKVVYSRSVMMMKLTMNTTTVRRIEVTKEEVFMMLIQYWNMTPQRRIAKHMQQQAMRFRFLVQQSSSRFSQSMSYGSGALRTVMCWPLMAEPEQQVQNLQNSLSARLVEYLARNTSLLALERRVRNTMSS